MNFNKQSDIITIVLDQKNKPIKTIAVKQEPNALKEYKCNDAEHIQHISNKHKERRVLYITGQSGSGKSYYTLQYCRMYQKMYSGNSIYLFSSLDSDPTIDQLQGLKRIKFTAEFLLTPFTISDFENSLVIFDDYDCIQSKTLLTKLVGLLHMCLTTGRHTKTSIICITHNVTDRDKTKTILNESTSVTVFPLSTPPCTLQYLMYNYFGLEKDQIKKLKQLHKNSRWMTIHKTFPPIVMYEKGIYILNNMDEE